MVIGTGCSTDWPCIGVHWRAFMDKILPPVRARLGLRAARMPLASALDLRRRNLGHRPSTLAAGLRGGEPALKLAVDNAVFWTCGSATAFPRSQLASFLLEDLPMNNVHVITHPMVQHKLTLMRKKDASTNSFRRLLRELASLMAYEVTRDMPLMPVEIETPMEKMTGHMMDGKKLVFASILRAGTGILDGMLDVVPGARVGHVGLYRDPKTLAAVEYYFKMPDHMSERDVVIVDPMLATGNSAVAAVERIKEMNPKSIKFVCLVACPEGVKAMQTAHPDVAIFTAAIDRELNDHGYILPGLGDAGDRIFGTK
jgi:uracil phosphoribosyltransferase